MHELAHLLLNIDPVLSQKEKEHICNQFANEILISESVFINLIGNNRKRHSLKRINRYTVPIRHIYRCPDV